LLTVGILCCLETWPNSAETPHQSAISSPGFQGKTCTTAQDIPQETCVTLYHQDHYLRAGRGVKWTSASLSKETGGGNGFMVLEPQPRFCLLHLWTTSIQMWPC